MTTPAEATVPKKSNTMLYAGVIIVIVIIAGVAAFFLFGGGGQPFTPTRNLSLNGNATSGWNSTNPGPAITIRLSDKVRLNLTSADALLHNFFIDYNANGIRDSGEAKSSDFGAGATSPINYDFTPSQAGTFTYYCEYHTSTMRGTVTIQNA